MLYKYHVVYILHFPCDNTSSGRRNIWLMSAKDVSTEKYEKFGGIRDGICNTE